MTLVRFTVRTVAALLVLVVVVLGATATRVWLVARQDNRRVSDTIVVLGAAQYNGRPSAVLVARLDHARLLFKEHVAPRIITVGGKQAGDTFTEASASKTWLVAHGVPAARVVAVAAGRDTLSSVVAVESEMARRHWTSSVLVTDPWHALRARAMANDHDMNAVVSPTRQGPAVRQRSTELRYIARETLAYLYYKVFHRSADSGTTAV